jgi:MFS family permease
MSNTSANDIAAASAAQQQPQTGGELSEKTDSSKTAISADDRVSGDDSIPEDKVLTEHNTPGALGYKWSTWKKWKNLIVVFLVQCSMNFNASLYANGQRGLAQEFGVSDQVARSGAALFLITYAFGCELWAPWSEEFGRKMVLQISLFLVNVFCLPVALAKNINTVLACRSLGGLASAGGSITLGIVADMYHAEDQGYPVAFVVLASVGGSIFGPIIGGFVEDYMHWRWAMWFQLVAGGAIQLIHLVFADETQPAALLQREAKRLQKSGENNVHGPNEGRTWADVMSFKKMGSIWLRPFKMFVTEPIVLFLSLLSGFSDALIFMGFQSFGLAYESWGFTAWQVGLTFVAIGLGYLLSYLFFVTVAIPRLNKRRAQPNLSGRELEYAKYEMRLWGLLPTAACLPLGLLIFAWTSSARNHWMGPVVGSLVIGIANFAIYQATIDYMVAAYGSEYSASATGGNGFARDFLAGVLTWAAIPFYEGLEPLWPDFPLAVPTSVLAVVSLVLVAGAVAIYFKGPGVRAKSRYYRKMVQAEDRRLAAKLREGTA